MKEHMPSVPVQHAPADLYRPGRATLDDPGFSGGDPNGAEEQLHGDPIGSSLFFLLKPPPSDLGCHCLNVQGIECIENWSMSERNFYIQTHTSIMGPFRLQSTLPKLAMDCPPQLQWFMVRPWAFTQ